MSQLSLRKELSQIAIAVFALVSLQACQPAKERPATKDVSLSGNLFEISKVSDVTVNKTNISSDQTAQNKILIAALISKIKDTELQKQADEANKKNEIDFLILADEIKIIKTTTKEENIELEKQKISFTSLEQLQLEKSKSFGKENIDEATIERAKPAVTTQGTYKVMATIPATIGVLAYKRTDYNEKMSLLVVQASAIDAATHITLK